MAASRARRGAATIVWAFSALAHTDSAGGFAVRLPDRGRYTYSVLSVALSRVRGSIDVTHSTETLRVAMHHGPWICRVRLTMR